MAQCLEASHRGEHVAVLQSQIQRIRHQAGSALEGQLKRGSRSGGQRGVPARAVERIGEGEAQEQGLRFLILRRQSQRVAGQLRPAVQRSRLGRHLHGDDALILRVPGPDRDGLLAVFHGPRVSVAKMLQSGLLEFRRGSVRRDLQRPPALGLEQPRQSVPGGLAQSRRFVRTKRGPPEIRHNVFAAHVAQDVRSRAANFVVRAFQGPQQRRDRLLAHLRHAQDDRALFAAGGRRRLFEHFRHHDRSRTSQRGDRDRPVPRSAGEVFDELVDPRWIGGPLAESRCDLFVKRFRLRLQIAVGGHLQKDRRSVFVANLEERGFVGVRVQKLADISFGQTGPSETLHQHRRLHGFLGALRLDQQRRFFGQWHRGGGRLGRNPLHPAEHAPEGESHERDSPRHFQHSFNSRISISPLADAVGSED